MDKHIEELLAQAVDPSTLASDGNNLTSPRSWGVYELHMTRGAIRRFRFGNHPVRGLELEREFGMVRVVGVFTSRTAAEELQRLLNARGAR